MASPTPSAQQQHDELDALDLHVSEAAPSPLVRALHAIFDERSVQIQLGYTAEHDVRHGVDHLVGEALHRIAYQREVSRADRIAAAALLLASLEVDDYTEDPS